MLTIQCLGHVTCNTLNGRLIEGELNHEVHAPKIIESTFPILARMKRHGHWEKEFNFEDLGIHGGINFVDPENYLKGLTAEINIRNAQMIIPKIDRPVKLKVKVDIDGGNIVADGFFTLGLSVTVNDGMTKTFKITRKPSGTNKTTQIQYLTNTGDHLEKAINLNVTELADTAVVLWEYCYTSKCVQANMNLKKNDFDGQLVFGVDKYNIEGKLVGNTFNMTMIENNRKVVQAMNATVDALYADISLRYLSTEIKVKLDNVGKSLKITGIFKGKKYSLTAMFDDKSGTIEAYIHVNDKKVASARIDLQHNTKTHKIEGFEAVLALIPKFQTAKLNLNLIKKTLKALVFQRNKELASLDARITQNKKLESNLKIYRKTFEFKAEKNEKKLGISLTTGPNKITIFNLRIENSEDSIFEAHLKLPFPGIDMRSKLWKNETQIQLKHDIKFGNDIISLRFKLDRTAGKDSFELAIFPKKKPDFKLLKISFLHDGSKLHFSTGVDLFSSTLFSLDMRRISSSIMTGQATLAIIKSRGGGFFSSYKEPEKKQWDLTATAEIIPRDWGRHDINLLGIWERNGNDAFDFDFRKKASMSVVDVESNEDEGRYKVTVQTSPSFLITLEAPNILPPPRSSIRVAVDARRNKWSITSAKLHMLPRVIEKLRKYHPYIGIGHDVTGVVGYLVINALYEGATIVYKAIQKAPLFLFLVFE